MKTESVITKIRARAIAVRGDEIDTDRIIPARFLRCVTFDGLGEQAFRDERFDGEGKAKAHPLNDSRFKGAGIMAVNRNFGCGSSREHAPQSLARWGIKALVGESFADIFAGNCAAIGVPAVTASAADVASLQDAIERDPSLEVSIDLETMKLTAGKTAFAVRMPSSHRSNFLAGSWDTVAALLANKSRILETAAHLPYLGGTS